MRRVSVILVAGLALALAASPIGASGAKTLITVRLKEFKVLPAPVSAKRGVVVFSVRNTGKVAHELVVLKTKLAPGKLRVKRGRASLVGRVGRVGPLKPRASRMLMLTLARGNYILLCNLPGHYQAGQRIGFRVSWPAWHDIRRAAAAKRRLQGSCATGIRASGFRSCAHWTALARR